MNAADLKEAQQKALENIKDVFNDGSAEINGRSYKFTVMTFAERRTVFAYMSSIKAKLAAEDFSFLDEPKFKEIESNVIFKRVTVEDMAISKMKVNIFEDHPEDYLMFISTALMVISYPFLKGKSGV